MFLVFLYILSENCVVFCCFQRFYILLAPRHLPYLILDGFIKDYEGSDIFGVQVVRLPSVNSLQFSFKGNAAIFHNNLRCSLQKVVLFKNNDDHKMRNEKNKIKSDRVRFVLQNKANLTTYPNSYKEVREFWRALLLKQIVSILNCCKDVVSKI